ncbi:MAG: ADP-ribosylglycohydrolase family protein [Selenomonadaceae bacterium]|nr:ADP-ribosylglycohydrolase family protein [Selenomonadaceae bacterium]
MFKDDFATLPEDEIKSSGYVVSTLEAVIWCLLNTDDYKTLVLDAVNLGGDTDTVGAIAGGIGGLYYGVQQIPAEWLKVLKRREYLEEMAEKFFLAIS